MPLPRLQPIIPTWRKEPFDDPQWVFDFKYDGFRGLCYIEQGRGRFISRNGNALSRFDDFGDELAAELEVDEAILDLIRATRAPTYVAFDILWLAGTDLRSMPLSERRKRLQAILPASSSIISESLSVVGKGRELFELTCSNDLEGIVAKRLDDPYGPRVRWLKIKNRDYSQKEGRADLFDRSRPWKPGRSGRVLQR